MREASPNQFSTTDPVNISPKLSPYSGVFWP